MLSILNITILCTIMTIHERQPPDFISVLCIQPSATNHPQWHLSPALSTFPKSAKSIFKQLHISVLSSVFSPPSSISNSTWPHPILPDWNSSKRPKLICSSENTQESIKDELQSESTHDVDKYFCQRSQSESSEISKELTKTWTCIRKNSPRLGRANARWKNLLELCPAHLRFVKYFSRYQIFERHFNDQVL